MVKEEQKEENRKSFLKDFYIKFWELLFNAKLNQSILFDKYIFYFSAIGIGFSLKLTLEAKYHSYIYLIIFGILLLTFSTIISLISIFLSQKALDIQINNLNEEIEFFLNEEYIKKEDNKNYSSLINKLNLFSLINLAIGLLLILLFFGLNYILQEERKMTENYSKDKNKLITEIQQPPKEGDIVEEGFAPPNPPTISPPQETNTSQSTDNKNNPNKK